EDFLVASERGIKNNFPVTFAFRAVASAAEDPSIFQRKDSLHCCSRGWILRILLRVQRTLSDKITAEDSFHGFTGAICGTDSADPRRPPLGSGRAHDQLHHRRGHLWLAVANLFPDRRLQSGGFRCLRPPG